MTRSTVRTLWDAALLLSLSLSPMSAAAQTAAPAVASPAPAPTATPGPAQIAFPGQYALAPAEWRYPVWPSSCRRFEGSERVACLEFVASDYGRLARFSAANAALAPKAPGATRSPTTGRRPATAGSSRASPTSTAASAGRRRHRCSSASGRTCSPSTPTWS